MEKLDRNQRKKLIISRIKGYSSELAFDLMYEYEYSIEYDEKRIKQYMRILKNMYTMDGRYFSMVILI